MRSSFELRLELTAQRHDRVPREITPPLSSQTRDELRIPDLIPRFLRRGLRRACAPRHAPDSAVTFVRTMSRARRGHARLRTPRGARSSPGTVRRMPWRARYEFVHELIRTTLVNGLSLPRRQRLHLKIADALERLRAGSLDSHASVLAHHLYQAGAAADVQRTAKALALAGRRALESGAFEEALETCEQLIGLGTPISPSSSCATAGRARNAGSHGRRAIRSRPTAPGRKSSRRRRYSRFPYKRPPADTDTAVACVPPCRPHSAPP